jgi:hypothetical protein
MFMSYPSLRQAYGKLLTNGEGTNSLDYSIGNWGPDRIDISIPFSISLSLLGLTQSSNLDSYSFLYSVFRYFL